MSDDRVTCSGCGQPVARERIVRAGEAPLCDRCVPREELAARRRVQRGSGVLMLAAGGFGIAVGLAAGGYALALAAFGVFWAVVGVINLRDSLRR